MNSRMETRIQTIYTVLYHITYGPGVPEHSAGNRINALVQYRFFVSPLLINNVVTNGAQMTSCVMT